jgi:PAS domain S-box-containing protein
MSVVNTGTLFCFPLLENAVKNSEHILADEENRAENCGQQMRLVLAGCFAIVGLFIIGRHNYLLFHALVELGAVAVAWSVFFLVWNARRLKTPPAFVMLGIGYALVGALDLLHTLAYEGMDVFPGAGTDLATQLWMAARFIETAALLLFPLCFIAGGFCRWGGYVLTVAAIIMLGGLFVWDSFPECFNAETGLTLFKVASEYVVMGVLAGSVLLTYRKRKLIGRTVALFLSGAMLVTIVSEFCFTLYASPFGTANMIGHLFKVASFMLIYRALIVESLERPMETLAHGLRKETERYARIIETAVDGFWIVDMQGRIRDANASAERMTGFPRDTLISMRINDIEANESAEETSRHMKMVVEKGHDLFGTRHRHKDGSILDVEVSCGFLPYDNGRFIVFVRDISERKIAEDLLRASEERYRSFVQHTSEGVYLLMLDAPIDVSLPIETQVDALYDRAYVAECNDAFAKMYGLKNGSALLNKTLVEFHGGKDHPVNRAEVRKFVESGYNVVDEETEETGADGVSRWFSNSTVGIVEDGMLIRMWGTQTDITDRKKATRRVEESESRYRGIVSALPDLLFGIDAELRFTDVQTSVPEMLLVPADEIVGKTAWDILPPDIARLTDKKVRATLESGKMQVYHYSLDVRDVTKECETRMVPCGNGEVLAIVRDITEQKRMASDLAAEHAKLEAIFNASPDILVLKDNDSVYQRVNPTFCSFIGKNDHDIIGLTDYDLFPKEEARQYMAGDAAVVQTGVREDQEWQVAGQTGKRWLQVIKTPVCNAGGQSLGVLCTGRDVSDHHRLKNLLLTISQKEQEKLAQELHDGLCQDLKGLEIQAALLEDGIIDNDKDVKELATELSEGINLAVRRAYGITQGMFPIDLETRCFSEALQDLAEKTALHRETRLLISVQDDLSPQNQSQAHQLYRIAQEAMNNALQHSNATEIELVWREEKGRKLLSVRDNGIGIGIKDHKAPGGLGLQVMSSRAQSINAGLTVRNREKCGTEVLVRLKNE